MEYDLTKPWESLDPWQKDIIKSKGNICIVSGRQCGKSTVISILAAKEALNKPNSFILIGSGVIDQAELLFRKIKDYILTKHKNQVKGNPTIGFMELKNNSKIICVPIGDTGDSMRGYTATMIIIDEASLVPDRAWDAIEPVIAISKGRIILLSTGKYKKGFFYKAFLDKETYFVKQISARDCPRYDQKFLDKKQAEKSPAVFAQEYLGEFMDDYNRKFTEEWIKKVCSLEKPKEAPLLMQKNNFLGVDVGGGVGKGETTLEGFNATNSKYIYQNVHIYSNTIAGPDIERQIETLKNKYRYDRKSIGFDSGGLGSGTFAYMMENPKLKRCIIAIDNATRPIEHAKDGDKIKLLKEYAYDLIEEMGWRGELKCFNERSIKQSFESIQIEYSKRGERKYSGSYDHIVEGIKNGIWVAKAKGLKIWVR